MAVTIKELSIHCGLSVSTVSKALNDYPDVSEETKQQVRAAADELGYRPSAIARSLKIGRTFNLGVLYSDDTESGLTHSFFSPVLQSFKKEARTPGLRYHLYHPQHEPFQDDLSRALPGLSQCGRHLHRLLPLRRKRSSPARLRVRIPLVTIDHVFNDRALYPIRKKRGRGSRHSPAM